MTAVEAPRILDCELVAQASAVGELPPPLGAEVAFLGRSNVGKSTLINALLGRHRLVRTSSTPGCTRRIGFVELRTANEARLTFVDLPGYGYARRSKAERATWGPLVEGYLLGRPTLVAAVVLVDPRRGLQAEERDLLELLAAPATVQRRSLETVIVATKADKLSRAEVGSAVQAIRRAASLPVVPFSARDPKTRAAVWNALRKATGLAL